MFNPKLIDKDIISFDVKDNGFVIKFKNGFMIQSNKVTAVPSNVGQENSIWVGEIDLGNWEVPFVKLISSTNSISSVAGDRSYWLMGYAKNSNPSQTFCGKRRIGLTWNGFSNDIDVITIGYGTWK